MAIEKLETLLLTTVGGSPEPDNWYAITKKRIDEKQEVDSSTPRDVLEEISEDVFRAWNMNVKKVKITRSYHPAGSDDVLLKTEFAYPVGEPLRDYIGKPWKRIFVDPGMVFSKLNDSLEMYLENHTKSLVDDKFLGNSTPHLEVYPIRYRKDKLKFYALYPILTSGHALSPSVCRVASAATSSQYGIKITETITTLSKSHFKTGQSWNYTRLVGSVTEDVENTFRSGYIEYEITETFY